MKTFLSSFLSLFLLTIILHSSIAVSSTSNPANPEEIRAAVAGLALSFQGYTLCSRLTDEQIRFGETHRSEKSYPGTYTLVDDSVNVVVDAVTHSVIAIYQRFADVGQSRVKEVVGSLMGSFGEPTNIAHDKMIYWLYSPDGSMSEAEFDKAKDRKEGEIDIIASVKFSSSRPIEEEDKPTTLYWILSSNQVTRMYVAEGKEQ